MQTESTIETRAVERTATIALVRVVDFEKIAAAYPDGSIPVDAVRNGGDFVVVITPNGRNATPTRVKVADANTGTAYLDGFVACAELKRKGPRKPKANGGAGKPAKPPKPTGKAAGKAATR